MSKRALLIAEKPDLMRKIEQAYNSNKSKFDIYIDFVAQRGHLLTLKWPHEIDAIMTEYKWETLPFYPDEHGGWQYKIPKEKKIGNYLTSEERFKAIKELYDKGNYDFIIHAGDPDREGELLVWETLNALGVKIPVKRFWSNDVTEGAIIKALNNLRDESTDEFLINLKSESYGRQHADYIMGMNLSRAGSLAMSGRASIGRVKTPILSIVCERELAIQNFKPSTSYGVKANYSEDFNGQYFIKADTAAKEDDDEKEKDEDTGLIYFDTRKEAQDFIDTLSSKATVVSFETKQTKILAPKLFKLATAQIEAGKAGYSADRTLAIIQSLYEKTYISYPRTDCECMSSNEDLASLVNSASCVLNASEQGKFMPLIDTAAIKKVLSSKKYVNDKELESHGHSALIPTTNKPKFDSLSKDEQFIYNMIARRFLAVFLPPIIQNKTVLIADINGNTFKSNGKTLVDAGFSEIFNTKFTDMEIPVHKEGDILSVTGFELAEKTTKCPSRFTSADLVAVCENPKKYLDNEELKKTLKEFHIGTPATRASIIEGLHANDGYLAEKKEGKKVYLVPTDNGMKIYQNLKTTMICKVDMTADWDMLLEKIGQGQITLKQFEDKIKADNEALIEEFKTTKMQSLSGFTIVCSCPKCKTGNVLSAKKGFFCNNWKKDGTGCDFTVYGFACESKITDNEFSKMIKGEHITKTVKNKGKSWSQEMYLDIDNHKIEWVNANADFESENTGLQCPVCGKDIITTPFGYKCVDYSNDGNGCKFSIGEICGVKLSVDDLADLVVNKKTKLFDKLKSKKGKTFAAYIVLDENKDISFEFPDADDALPENSVISICPTCGASIINSTWDFHCANEACSVKIPKWVCKKKLSDTELERLFVKKKSPLIKGLQGKKGKFDAYLLWDGADKITFDFPTRKRK